MKEGLDERAIPRRPRRFTIEFLMLLTWVVCLALAPVEQWGREGILLSVSLLLSALLALYARYVLALIIVAIIVIFTVVIPPIGPCDGPHNKNLCRNNLRNVALSIINYHHIHGHYPPPYLADENGKPMLSWRVLILPYLEEKRLYDQFQLDEPWDSPTNRKLLEHMPFEYRCPADKTAFASWTTRIVAVTGENTVWSPTTRRTESDVIDGLENTALIVEASAARPWTAPDDIDLELLVNPDPAGGSPLLSNQHGFFIPVAYCDAQVQRFTNLAEFRAAVTIDDDGNGEMQVE